MKYFIILCLLLTSTGAIANENELTLQELIAQLESTAADKDKLPIYTQIVKKTWRNNAKLAADYGQQALLLHDNYHSPEQEALLIANLVKVYVDKLDLINAQALIERGVLAANQTNNDKVKASNLFYRALIYQLQDKLILALDGYQNTLKAYEKLDRPSTIGSIYNNIGNTQLNLGNYYAALENFQKALPLLEEAPNRATYANTLINVGRVFAYLEDFSQAEHNYLLGLSEIDEEGYPRVYLEGHGHLGKLYEDTGQYDKALEHFKSSERVAKKHNNSGKLLYNYFDQIKLAIQLEDEVLLNNVMDKIDALSDINLDENQENDLLYIKTLFAAEKENWLVAEENINKLIERRSFNSPYQSLQDSLELAVKIKAELGKVQDAKSMLLNSLALHDQKLRENRNSTLAQYAQLYKINQKEQELQELQRQKLVQENNLLLEQKQSRQRLFIFIVITLVLAASFLLIAQRSRNLTRQNQLSQQLLDEKKQFFADISHELRTPLTVFKLKMEELEYEIAEDPKAIYKLLHDRIESFNLLINDISLLAKNDQGELLLHTEKIELLPFFQQHALELSVLAKDKGLEATTTIQLSPDDEARFDRARITQVLVNLFSNACRYTSSPGVIEFIVSMNGNNLKIVIQDSPPGLSKGELEKVFERLYRADESRSRKLGGSGLGLSICQELVEAHSGAIHAEKSSLGGVKFVIELPINAGERASSHS